jgi:hypothetical protein
MFRCEFLEIRMREKLPKSASAHITRPHSARARAAPAGGERCVARQPGASTTLKPTSTFKRAVYHA